MKLRVESHLALDIRYRLEETMERINSYFVYRAVTDDGLRKVLERLDAARRS